MVQRIAQLGHGGDRAHIVQGLVALLQRCGIDSPVMQIESPVVNAIVSPFQLLQVMSSRYPQLIPELVGMHMIGNCNNSGTASSQVHMDIGFYRTLPWQASGKMSFGELCH